MAPTTAGEGAGLRVNLLGPLEVWDGRSRLRSSGVVQERILVTLLLETGRVLPVSRLVAAAWGDAPPATASHQVRKAVADLRRRLPGGTALIVTDGPGYRVVLDGDRLDLTQFQDRLREAKHAAGAGRAADAVRALQAGLALWRGRVLSGTGGPVIEAAATALEERRLAAADELYRLRLELGEGAELIAELRALADQFPLRESLRGHLMLALYRAGRQADALEEYHRVRKLLDEELGISPGPGLARVYEDILRESPELGGPAPARVDPVPPSAPAHTGAIPASAPARTGPVPAAAPPHLGLVPPAPPSFEPPHNLPYSLADFTGRERELELLLERARAAAGPSTRIVAIDGMGGSGKTVLAVRAAHELAADYPDGQLHIDLRGNTPGESPVPPETALDRLLRTLGLPGDRIPEDVAGRTALWRGMLAGKRLLLLLDNAADAAGIRPLLPTEPGCLTLITSRARLLDLDGADWISIGVMAPEESAALVSATLGGPRVAAEPEAAAELARLCGHLPLALRIATARLRNRPRWTLAYLVDRLRDETRRLDELSSGERSVAANLRLSYQVLDARSRTSFRMLVLHPGGEMDRYSTAALLGTGVREAEDVLEALLDVHLLQQPDIGWYSFHDLVRDFARSLIGKATEEEDSAAVGQLLDYYLAGTETACMVLFPGRRRRPTGLPEPDLELPPLAAPEAAQGWFVREHTTLLAAVALAERSGFDRYTVCLARNIGFSLNARGCLDEFREVSRTAVATARRLGDPALLGVSLANLGVACWKVGDFTEGIDVAQEARDVAAGLGDRHTEAHSESTLGLYKSLLGRFPEALEHLERSLEHERELGTTRAEAESLTALSTLYEQWGRCEEAVDAARRAVELGRRLGRNDNELAALNDLILACLDLGRYDEAENCLVRARELCDGPLEPGHVAMAWALSADACHHLGRPELAGAHAEHSLTLAAWSESPLRRAKTENTVGRVHFKRGEFAAALALHAHAHRLASAVGYRAEEAYALLGMARAGRALSDEAAAVRHETAADELFAAMGVPTHRRRG